jgi:hypothetical protein
MICEFNSPPLNIYPTKSTFSILLWDLGWDPMINLPTVSQDSLASVVTGWRSLSPNSMLQERWAGIPWAFPAYLTKTSPVSQGLSITPMSSQKQDELCAARSGLPGPPGEALFHLPAPVPHFFPPGGGVPLPSLTTGPPPCSGCRANFITSLFMAFAGNLG